MASKKSPSVKKEKPTLKLKTKTNHSQPKKQSKLKISLLSVIGSTAIIAIIIVVTVMNSHHETELLNEAKAASEVAYNESHSASTDFGTNLADLVADLNISTENFTDDDVEHLSILCFNEFGYQDWMFGTSEPNAKEGTTKYYRELTESYNTITNALKEISNNIRQCEPAVRAVAAEVDGRIAAAKAAEEEAARLKAEEEAKKKAEQEAYAKRTITYDKFTNQIYEGMTLDQLKAVWTGFDTYCKVAASSGSYVMYSCNASIGSDIKVLSFTFYGGRLQSKAQSGL